jgi:hypothetical protein
MSKKETRRAAREAFPKAKAPVAKQRPVGGKYSSKTAKEKAKTRTVQTIKKPSLKRAAIQGIILAVLYFVIIWVWQKGGGLSFWGALIIAVLGFVFFTVIAYAIDRYTYNRKMRKLHGPGGTSSHFGK